MNRLRQDRRPHAATPSQTRPGLDRTWIARIVPFLVAIAVYLPTLGSGFVWDDVSFIVRNPAAHDWSGIGESLGHGYGWVPHESGVAETIEGGARDSALYYRPLVTLANGLQWVVSAGRPGAFHGLNLALHAIVSALVASILLALGAGALWAGLVGVLFAVHPMASEAVAWISGRTDLMATSCVTVAVWFWV
ncbi:MAG: hypothetical protein KC729_15685, partial [Candidatus Eisenbacteria bacterium]|nr:hypothetical protein [Candidatus Eisenbacteria bacterium]